MTRKGIFVTKLVMAASLVLSSCASPYVENETPISFTPSTDGTALIAQGMVDDRAPNALRLAISENPDVRTLILHWVPGSLDDEYNLETGRIVRALGLTTVVPHDGLVASGGTDLFLAGTKRKIMKDACIGVHSWADDENGEYGDDLPKEDSVHRFYTNYYKEMGIDPAFYWFTLRAAGPNEMYWMTSEEWKKYRMDSSSSQTVPTGRSGKPMQSRCEKRAEKFERTVLHDA